jgi:hypothetical protein
VRPGTWYAPELEETAVRVALVLRLLTVMLALGTTAPDWSVTTPAICPVSTCAEATTPPMSSRAKTTATMLRNAVKAKPVGSMGAGAGKEGRALDRNNFMRLLQISLRTIDLQISVK